MSDTVTQMLFTLMVNDEAYWPDHCFSHSPDPSFTGDIHVLPKRQHVYRSDQPKKVRLKWSKFHYQIMPVEISRICNCVNEFSQQNQRCKNFVSQLFGTQNKYLNEISSVHIHTEKVTLGINWMVPRSVMKRYRTHSFTKNCTTIDTLYNLLDLIQCEHTIKLSILCIFYSKLYWQNKISLWRKILVSCYTIKKFDFLPRRNSKY